MLDHDLIKRKTALITEELERLLEFKHLTLADTAKDFRTQAIVERLFERIITRAIDVNQHFIAELGSEMPFPRTYRETFLRLANFGVYDETFAEQIAPSAGFRNALVHDYDMLDEATLTKNIGEAITDYNEYCRSVLDFLDQQKAEQADL